MNGKNFVVNWASPGPRRLAPRLIAGTGSYMSSYFCSLSLSLSLVPTAGFCHYGSIVQFEFRFYNSFSSIAFSCSVWFLGLQGLWVLLMKVELFTSSVNNIAEFLTGIAWICRLLLVIQSFATLILPVHEHRSPRIFFNLFFSSWKFLEQRSFTPLVVFIPRCLKMLFEMGFFKTGLFLGKFAFKKF